MKLKRLLFTGLSILAFTACSNDDSIDEGGNSSVKADAYASFTINLSDNLLSSRSPEQSKVDKGSEEEQKINNVRVVLYANGRVAKHEDFAIRSSGESFDGDGLSKSTNLSTFVTKAVEVKKQNYLVAVLVNATSDVIEKTAENRTYSELEEALENVKAEDFTKDGFMMSNAQGMVNLLASDLASNKEDAEENPLKVQVDRVVAKVSVKTSDNLADDELAYVKAKGWIVDITNKHTYPMRHLAPQVGGSYEVVDHKNPQNSTARAYRYAKDPNFDIINLIGKSSSERMTVLEKEFNYFDNTAFANAKEVNTDSDYVLENTFDGRKSQISQSQTTRVILKASYLPKELKLEDGDSWISYSGIPLTMDTFNESVKKALQLSWNESVKGLTPSFTNEIKNMVFLSAYIQQLDPELPKDKEFLDANKHLDIVTFENLNELQEIIDAAESTEDKIADIRLTAEQIESIGIEFKVGLDDEAFSVSNLNFYKGGDSYYPLYIKHFAGLDDNESYGKYGVVRNNSYIINVSKIKRPGLPMVVAPVGPTKPSVPTTPVDPKDPKPTPEDPNEPEKPINPEEIHIAYEVEILPWLVREQTEIID